VLDLVHGNNVDALHVVLVLADMFFKFVDAYLIVFNNNLPGSAR